MFDTDLPELGLMLPEPGDGFTAIHAALHSRNRRDAQRSAVDRA